MPTPSPLPRGPLEIPPLQGRHHLLVPLLKRRRHRVGPRPEGPPLPRRLPPVLPHGVPVEVGGHGRRAQSGRLLADRTKCRIEVLQQPLELRHLAVGEFESIAVSKCGLDLLRQSAGTRRSHLGPVAPAVPPLPCHGKGHEQPERGEE